MSYPIKILPNPAYKNIDCNLSNFYLIRYVDGGVAEQDLKDPLTGEVKVDYICSPRENIADLSTSLLGVFETQHIKVQLTSVGNQKYNEYCAPDCQVDIPEVDTDFILSDTRTFWTVQIGKIHGQEVDYTTSTNPFKAICQVIHTPMKWNYWHFSVNWITHDDFLHLNPDLFKKKGWIKRLCHAARVLISNYATTTEPNYYELNKECFMKEEAIT